MSFDGRLLSGLSVLAAVVEAGSFSRAGEVLGLSASGVSRSIDRLEERLGVRLLNRTTRTMNLTNEGRALYERASPHLEGIEVAASYVSVPPLLYEDHYGSALIQSSLAIFWPRNYLFCANVTGTGTYSSAAA